MNELIPGEFAIRTSDTNNYLSWLYDQSSGTGTVITSATTLGQTEKFKLTAWTPQFTLIQTLDGQNVTVASEGGLTLIQPIEETSKFTLIGPYYGDGHCNIRTRYGPFVSAVDGGGQTSNAFLTDITTAHDWEAFSIVKSGDLGSGYRYAIRPFKTPNPFSLWLTANSGGGGGTLGAVSISTPSSDGIFTLIRAEPPSSGGYVLQTGNGFNYLTSVNGGGLDGGDNLHTDAWKPLSWEVFNIVDQGDATYCIQTSSGFYLGYNPSPKSTSGTISTDIGTPDAPPPGWITKFEFLMVRTPVHGDIVYALP